MMHEITLRVTSIRSQSPKGFGGCIFTCKPIDESGDVKDAKAYYVVKATGLVLGEALVQTGQWWRVWGITAERTLDVNGYRISEWQIDAVKADLLRPSGEHIVLFLADNPSFVGIGQVKARKLWNKFGERLYVLLDTADVNKLATVLTPESALQVIGAWSQYGDSRTLQWLQAEGIDKKIGQKVLEFFGRETPEKLKEDPYRLLSFCASWRHVDSLAQRHFDVAFDDPRRLQGAIEEACYRVFADGHTTVLFSDLMHRLNSVLGTQSRTFPWRNLVNVALSTGLTNGSFVIGLQGIQPLGAFAMEKQVARSVAERLKNPGFAPLMSPEVVDLVLNKFEKSEIIQLNLEQRQAAHLASNNAFLLITGGAGVGKTTVLKALYQVYDRAGVEVIQLALAGRAVKRMQEATGRKAFTIAKFLCSFKSEHFSKPCVVVVDEASMVDIISMYRLCEVLPPFVRMVLVGDPAQLMPVGPGLVLHALTHVPQVPSIELKVVKRYDGHIALAATSIREGQWPDFKELNPNSIGFTARDPTVACEKSESIPQEVLRLYLQDPNNTQILCARRNGIDGVKMINALCQKNVTAGNAPLTIWSQQHETAVHTGFNLGDPIICNRNLYERDLQNGSLGLIVEIETVKKMLTNADGEVIDQAIAWVEWDDGVRRPIFEDMLDDLSLSYAVTVHKAQGSQWPRVVIPLTGNRLLDRTLVYTAVTRAQSQVLMVGDLAAASAAVKKEPRVRSRHVALDLTIRQLLLE